MSSNVTELAGRSGDVTFVVGDTMEKVRCPKEVLIHLSQVFEKMFQDHWEEEKQSEIIIPDANAESFTEFIEYICSQKFRPKLETAADVIYLAHKYDIKTMEADYSKFLIGNLNMERVLPLYDFAQFMGIPDLSQQCWAYMIKDSQSERPWTPFTFSEAVQCSDHIQTLCIPLENGSENTFLANCLFRNAEAFFKSEDFLKINLMQFEQMLTSKDLRVAEVLIFQAAIRWAENVCVQRKMACTPRNKRKIMKPLFRMIRFTLMTLSQFTEEVTNRNPGILTKTETNRLVKYFNANREPTCKRKRLLPYNVRPRMNNFYIPVFHEIPWQSLRSEVDHFETYLLDCKNASVKLTGIELHGATIKPEVKYRDVSKALIHVVLVAFEPKVIYPCSVEFSAGSIRNHFSVKFPQKLVMDPNRIYILRIVYPPEFNFRCGWNCLTEARIACTPTDVQLFSYKRVQLFEGLPRPIEILQGRLRGIHFKR